jgi:hypothetical protein
MPLPKVVRLVDYVIVSRSHFALSTGALTPVNKLGYNPLDAIMPGLLVHGLYSNRDECLALTWTYLGVPGSASVRVACGVAVQGQCF